MMRRTRAAFAVLSMLGGALLSLAPACSLDWGVRPDPGDGGLPETTRPDVTVGDMGLDQSADAPGDSSVEPDAGVCAKRRADVAKAKKNAKACFMNVAGQCTTAVDDECSCQVVVRAKGSPEETAYTDAIAALLKDCGKPLDCPTAANCPPLGISTSWACLPPTGFYECRP